MQKLPRRRLAQAELVAFSEFNHATNGFAPMFPIEASVLWKTGERGVEHFLHRAVTSGGQLLSDDLLLFGFEVDGHTFNVASSDGSCKRARGSRSVCSTGTPTP